MAEPSHRNSASARAGNGEALQVALGQFEQLITVGLWAVLSGDRRISLVGVDVAFDELFLLATEPRGPAVVVLDATRVQGRPLRRLHELAPEVGIVTLYARGDQEGVPTLGGGATESLPLDARPDEIVQAVLRVAQANSDERRQPRLQALYGQIHDATAVVAQLTERQKEVLALLIDGNTRATIALTLDIKESTVHAHTRNIYKRLGVNSRSALREWAMSMASLN